MISHIFYHQFISKIKRGIKKYLCIQSLVQQNFGESSQIQLLHNSMGKNKKKSKSTQQVDKNIPDHTNPQIVDTLKGINSGSDTEVKEEQEKARLKGDKSHGKHKKIGKDTHKLKQAQQDQSELKEQEKQNNRKKIKKNKKKKKKANKQPQRQSQSSQNHQVKDQTLETTETRIKNFQLKKKKRKISTTKKSNSTKIAKSKKKSEVIDLDEIKVEEDYNWEQNNASHNLKASHPKKQCISLEDSDKIIQLFSLDAGDYRGLGRQMPHLGQKKIRRHLGVLFQKCLDAITSQALVSGRKIKDWQPYERRQIIRELHRIRSSNRLLSEPNVELRQTFHKLMTTHNHPQIVMTEYQMNFLYRKIEAFVRGYNQFSLFRKNHYIPPDQQDERRKPLIEGGYIMQNKAKREMRKSIQVNRRKAIRMDPDKLVLEWTDEEERELCQLYLNDTTNFEYMIQNLKTRFGESTKWNDFQILGKKIDHIIKLGLDRLQELTSNPTNTYSRCQKMEEDSKLSKEDLSRRRAERIKRAGPDSLEDLTSVVYNNKSVVKQVKEDGVIKNPSLLLMQVFASSQSYKVKRMLAGLLLEKYPEQSYVLETITVIKQFVDFVTVEQEKNHITLVRRRTPVIDDHRSHTYSTFDGKSIATIKNKDDEPSENIFEELNLLDEEGIQLTNPAKKQEEAKLTQPRELQRGEEPSINRASFEIFESDESDYEGFLSKK